MIGTSEYSRCILAEDRMSPSLRELLILLDQPHHPSLYARLQSKRKKTPPTEADSPMMNFSLSVLEEEDDEEEEVEESGDPAPQPLHRELA